MKPFYGSINENGLWWDGKTWKKQKETDFLELSSRLRELESKGCHPDGDLVCPRCRCPHFIRDNFDHLCDGCVTVILDNFPDHESVPFIKEYREKAREKYTVKKSHQ